MRRYYVDGREVFITENFEAGGIAHPGNWSFLYSEEDLNRYGITYVDEEDPTPTVAPEPIQTVSTYRMVKRLEEAGKLEEANAALETNLSAKARFYTIGSIKVNDPETLAMLDYIGADPKVIMAPE